MNVICIHPFSASKSADAFFVIVCFVWPNLQELELLEDMWRGEVQDLLTQISHLQSENNRLLASLSIKNTPSTEQEPQNEDQGRIITESLTIYNIYIRIILTLSSE